MRTVIAIALLASSAILAPAVAGAAEDRYGPSRAQPITITVAGAAGEAGQTRAVEAYSGRMLSWTGKVDPRTAPAPSPEAAPSSALPGNLYDAAPTAAATQPGGRVLAHPWLQPQPTTAVAPRPQPTPRPAPQATYRPAAQAASQYQSAPQVYARPYAQPTPAPVQAKPAVAPQPQPQYRPQPQYAAQPQLAGGPRPAPAPAPAPAPTPVPTTPVQAAPLPVVAAAQPAPQPAAAQPRRVAAASADGPTTARAYSVVREYGGQPDPITLPPPQNYWATRPGVTPDQGVVLDSTMDGTVDAVAETEAAIAESRTRRLEREEKAARAERSR